MRRLLARFALLVMLLLAGCTAPVLSPTTTEAPPAVSTAQVFCASVAQITQAECEALVALYISTNGNNWKEQSGWLNTTMPCTWYGVTCVDGKVDKLNLHDNGLSGLLPERIRDLSHLRQLYLQTNQLSGPIPAELAQLTELRILLLSLNQFMGPIPENLGNLQNLVALYLDGNQLSGPIPASLGNLQQLRFLFLQTNQLRGPIPATFGNLIGLQDLHLYENQLQGPVPENLAALPNLQHVKLENNDASLCLPAKLQTWADEREIYNPPPGGFCP